MSRAFAAFGVLGATACGILTAYATFQPELQRLKEEKEGKRIPGAQDAAQLKGQTALSDSIKSDILAARKEVGFDGEKGTKGGFAWGIRKWLRGEYSTPPKPDDNQGKT